MYLIILITDSVTHMMIFYFCEWEMFYREKFHVLHVHLYSCKKFCVTFMIKAYIFIGIIRIIGISLQWQHSV